MSAKGIDTHQQYKLNHRINNNETERRCSNCLEWKEETLDNFYFKNKSKPEMGFTPACRVCTCLKQIPYRVGHKEEQSIAFKSWHLKNKKYINDWCIEWRKNNHERKREYELEYYKNNTDKFKKYGNNHRKHDITKKEWNKCLEIFNHECAYCGIPEEEAIKLYNQVLHKDHADYNGANDLRNAVPACKSCNSQKRISDMEEWFRKQAFFTEEKLEFIMWWVIEGYKEYIEDKPPYKIIRKRNDGLTTYHYELWSVDDIRDEILLIANSKDKKGLDTYINDYLESLNKEGRFPSNDKLYRDLTGN